MALCIVVLLSLVSLTKGYSIETQMRNDMNELNDDRTTNHDDMETRSSNNHNYNFNKQKMRRNFFNNEKFIRSSGITHPIAGLEHDALLAHNTARRRHGVKDLTYDTGLENKALNYAKYLVENNLFQHDGNLGYEGENLAKGYSSTPVTFCGLAFFWYDEIRNYDENMKVMYNFAPIPTNLGHFTQMIWKSTTKVGCGGAWKETGDQKRPILTIYVCRYSPPGNVQLEFNANIMPSKANPRAMAKIKDICPSDLSWKPIPKCSDLAPECATMNKSECEMGQFGNYWRKQCPAKCGTC